MSVCMCVSVFILVCPRFGVACVPGCAFVRVHSCARFDYSAIMLNFVRIIPTSKLRVNKV